MHATKKTLEEAGDKATDEEKDSINAAITAVEEAIKGDDLPEIEAKTKDLTDASTSLAQKMYSEQAGLLKVLRVRALILRGQPVLQMKTLWMKNLKK